MADFPTLSSGTTILGPLNALLSFPVSILSFEDGSEQRFRKAKKLVGFRVNMSGIRKSDADAVRNFFETMKGSFDKTWSIDVDGTVYQNMVFLQDELRVEEASRGRYNVTFSCKQVK